MEQEQTSKFLVPAAIVVAGALIAGAIYMGGGSLSGPAKQGPVATNIEIPAVNSQDHILGNPNADVVIVEYSDIECPFCKVFHNTLKQLMTTYDGEVAWVYRHFPIAQLHTKAQKEAEATECAASLGGNAAFWSYLNKIFDTTNSNDSLDLAELPRIASDIGLDVATFNACLSGNQFAQKVEDSVAEAIKIGARGTPYSVLIAKDGTKILVNGAEPFATVKAKIDSLLK